MADGIKAGTFRRGNPAEIALFISTFLDGALFRNVMFPNFNYMRAIKSMRRIVLDFLKTGAPPAALPEDLAEMEAPRGSARR